MFLKKNIRTAALLLSLALIVSVLSGCAFSKPLPSISVSPEDAAGLSLPVTSPEDFKDAAGVYGEVLDRSSDVGYETLVMLGDKINIIYMNMDSEAQAKSMALSDQFNQDNASVSLVSSGENYDFYEEIADNINDSNVSSLYGYYLRVDTMLIFVTGSLDDRSAVKEEAVKFYHSLGYSVA